MDEPSASAELPEDFHRRLCRAAAVAMVATDARFDIVSWNEAAERLLGHTAKEMIGRPLFDIVPANRHALLHRLLIRTTERGAVSEFDLRLPEEAGKARALLVSLSPVPGDDPDAPAGAAAWIIDETNRRELSKRLDQAEKMASLGTVASGVAHHFNNILGGVATFVDFALASGDPASMKRALQMTAEAAARASKITQQLLSFAEHDTKRRDLADLTEVLLTFVHLVEHPLTQRGIKLQLDLRPAAIVPVEANRMHQVLGNLLANAEDAMPDGGTLTIGISQTDGEVQLTFADTGVGISPEHLPLVFEPFFTTKGLLAGGEQANPGLGLSVVHGLVTEMGGAIRADSKPGQGTVFTISFPIASRGT